MGKKRLPDKIKFDVIGGEKFIEIQEAAKLVGIHPAILEMGKRLMKDPGKEGGEIFLGLGLTHDVTASRIAGRVAA